MITPIPLHLIEDNPFQTRTVYDQAALAELVADIKQHGLMQAIVVRLAGQVYQVAVGHRRVRAYRLLADKDPEHYSAIPADVRELSDEEMATWAWSENAKRKDITPIEEATAIQRMAERFGWTQEQIAQRLGLARPTVANKLRLLRLPDKIQSQLNSGQVSERQALALLPLAELPPKFVEYADRKDGYAPYRPSELIEAAARLSSDDIRHRVSEIVRHKGETLAQLPAGFLEFEFGQKGYTASTCAACSVRFRQGATEYCGYPDCLKAKRKSWNEHRLRLAAAACGIPAIDGKATYNNHEDLREPWELDGLREVGCEHIRLRGQEEYGYAGSVTVPGHPDITVCVAYEPDAKCRHLTAVRTAHTRTHPDPVAIAQKARKKDVDALVDVAALQLAAWLVDDVAGAWYFLMLHPMFSSWSADALAKLDAAGARLALARETVRRLIYYNYDDNPKAARKYIADQFTAAGLPSPFTGQTTAGEDTTPPNNTAAPPSVPEGPGEGADTPLGRARRRLERVLLWIERAGDTSQGVATPEQIRGNLDNLDDLHLELIQLDVAHDDPLMDQIYAGRTTLHDWLTHGAPGTLARTFAGENVGAQTPEED